MKSFFGWGETASPIKERSITIHSPAPAASSTATMPPQLAASPNTVGRKTIGSEQDIISQSEETRVRSNIIRFEEQKPTVCDDDAVSELTCALTTTDGISKQASKKKSNGKWSFPLKTKKRTKIEASISQQRPPPSGSLERRDVDDSTHSTGHSDQRSAASSHRSTASSHSSGVTKARPVAEESYSLHSTQHSEKSQLSRQIQQSSEGTSLIGSNTSRNNQLEKPKQSSEKIVDAIAAEREQTDKRIKRIREGGKMRPPGHVSKKDVADLSGRGCRVKTRQQSRNARAQKEMDDLFVTVMKLTENANKKSQEQKPPLDRIKATNTAKSRKLQDTIPTTNESTNCAAEISEKISTAGQTKQKGADEENEDTLGRARMLLARRRQMTNAISGFRVSNGRIIQSSQSDDNEDRALNRSPLQFRTLRRVESGHKTANKQAHVATECKMFMPTLEDETNSTSKHKDIQEMDEIECGRLSPLSSFTKEMTNHAISICRHEKAIGKSEITLPQEEDDAKDYGKAMNVLTSQPEGVDDIESGRRSPIEFGNQAHAAGIALTKLNDMSYSTEHLVDD